MVCRVRTCIASRISKEPERILIATNLEPSLRHQLLADLGRFPPPVLKLVKNFGYRIYVLHDGETLADTPALRSLSPSEYEHAVRQAAGLVDRLLDSLGPEPEDELQAAMAQSAARRQLRYSLPKELEANGLEFLVAQTGEPFRLEEVAARRGVADRERWQSAFRILNRRLVEDGRALYDVVLLPYADYGGKIVPEARLRDALALTSSRLEVALGVHRHAEKEIVLHARYIPDPASEIGDFRVAVHELAHALDRCLDHLDGFRDDHRKALHLLYLAGESFTSARAQDNVRELFAEGVEAYLRGVLEPGPLADYIAKVLNTEFAPDAMPRERIYAPLPGRSEPAPILERL